MALQFLLRFFPLASLSLAAPLLLLAAPAPAAQHCTTDCYIAECWWVAPGRRCCRRECRRRCYSQPEPRYQEPQYARLTPPPAHPASADERDPAAVSALLALLCLIALPILAALNSGDKTEAAKRDAAETKALADKLEAAAREADEHIAAFLEQERKSGGRDG